MVELVIKIPEEVYKASQILDVKYEDTIQIPLEVIANGTLLPKGHGRIVDISKIEYMKVLNEAIHNKLSWEEAITRIKNSASTIIEADKESEE